MVMLLTDEIPLIIPKTSPDRTLMAGVGTAGVIQPGSGEPGRGARIGRTVPTHGVPEIREFPPETGIRKGLSMMPGLKGAVTETTAPTMAAADTQARRLLLLLDQEQVPEDLAGMIRGLRLLPDPGLPLRHLDKEMKVGDRRAWVEAEELNVDDLGTDAGVSILRTWIQERYQEVEVSKIAEALTQFFRKLRRQPSQTVREFNSAFDRAYARLIEIDCKLPEVAKAWVYLSALNLTNSEELSLLASVNNVMQHSFEVFRRWNVLFSLQTPWRKWHHTPGGSGDRRSGPRSTYMTEIAEEGDEEYPDGETVLPEEEAAELHEAFMAQEAAKNRYKEMRSRGYGYNQDNKDDAKAAAERLQQAKARSYCAGCKRRGHWHRDPECPLNAGKTPPQQTGTVAGEGWLQQYLEVSRRHGLKEQLLPCSEDFRFGVSRLFHANYTATIYIEIKGKGFWTRAAIVSGEVPLLLSRSLLASLGGKGFWTRAAIVSGEVPLLLSRSLLASLGMVFDLERHTACFRNLGAEETKLHYTSSGHPAIAVNPKPAASLEFPSLHQWGTREIIVIQPTCQQYTVFMTSAGSEPQEQRQATKTASPVKGLSSMTLGELQNKCTELGLHTPEKATKGLLMRMIRDQTAPPDQEIVTFGRYKNHKMCEVPQGYLEWSIRETESNPNASNELRHMAAYAKAKFEKETVHKEMVADPEVNAVIPYHEEETRSSRSSRTTWSMVQGTSSKGYANQEPIRPGPKGAAKASPKSLVRKNPEDEQRPQPMQTELPPEARQEINELMTRLAVLRDRYNLSEEGQ
eukprot:s1984_g4.t1